MNEFLSGRVLSAIVFLPLAGALALAATAWAARVFFRSPGLPAVVWHAAGVAITGVTFALALHQVGGGFDPERLGFQLVEHVAWLPEYGVHYFVGIDGLSLCLVLMTALLFPVVFVASWRQPEASPRTFVFFMLALESGMLGTFVSLNLAQFYVFWEIMLVPMYFIIGIWGGSRRIHAATKFFVFTLFGSLLMLVALLALHRMNFGNLDLVSLASVDSLMRAGGVETAGLLELAVPVGGDLVPWWQTQRWLFAAFALAFAIKIPIFPLHTWLPDAHVEAPTAGSVLLAGVLLKVGAFGFLRFALPLFPNAVDEAAPLFSVLALIGIVYGALVAMVQRDLKKLVAYSSIAHMGFVVLGIFSLNEHGLVGAVVQMLAHALATGALFMLVGALYERRQTREIVAFGGLAKPMPVFAVLFGVCALSSIGLPGLAGFVGEWLVVLGAFGARPAFAAVACLGVVLSAVYMTWMYRRVMFGPVDNPENRGLIDLGWRERFVFLAMIVPLVWIGLHPAPLLRRIEPSMLELQRVMDERRLPEPLPGAEAEKGGESERPRGRGVPLRPERGEAI